ncbi:MAG TPA: LysR family transcriptional regulator [Armatimonadota bacterium]|nr:LysR family transcriptional regulator [Armatimonadota bacterium]
MELQQLRVFVKVVETGSFTRAAELVELTQPAISHQIKKLETDLGQPLLHREGKQIRPTDAGEVFIDYARRILSLVEESEAILVEMAGGETGRLTLAAIGTTTAYLLPEILFHFRKEHPGIQIILRTMGAEEIEAMVDSGEAGLGIVGSHISTAGFMAIPLLSDPVIPVVEPGHPYAATGKARLADLAREPLILFGGWKNWTEYVLSMFQAIRVVPRVDLQVDSIEAVKRMVSLGLGFTIIPAIAAEAEIAAGKLAGITLTDTHSMERQIVLIYKKGRHLPAATRTFVDALQAACTARRMEEARRKE